jgi:hypothetical protein
MKFRIPKGCHRAFPPPLGIFFQRRSFRKAVVFSASCRQAPEGVDYWDVNKVFGFAFFTPAQALGYFLSVGPAWIARRFGSKWQPVPPHHIDSARFGARYDRVNGIKAIYAYCYVDGERVVKHLCDVPLEREVYMEVFITRGPGRNAYWFTVKSPHSVWRSITCDSVAFTHQKKWQYALGPYWGGNTTPDYTVLIDLKNLPHD